MLALCQQLSLCLLCLACLPLQLDARRTKQAAGPAVSEVQRSKPVQAVLGASAAPQEREFVARGPRHIEKARMAARLQDYPLAERNFLMSLNYELTEPQRRDVLIELANLYEELGLESRMSIVYEKFLRRFPDDPIIPQVNIRLGRLYRDMGATQQALGRFYNVLNMAVQVDRENMTMYRYLSLQAQLEVAKTYYQIADYQKALKMYARIQLLELTDPQREDVQFKKAYAYYNLEDYPSAMIALEVLFQEFPRSPFAPEGHYLLAKTYKAMGKTPDAVSQIVQLLSFDVNSIPDQRDAWTYWKRKASNDMANEFYEQADYMSALKIYQAMVPLSPDAGWQWPILYQIGLCFEHLNMLAKAKEAFELISSGSEWPDLPDPLEDPTMDAIRSTAQWRLEHLGWLENTEQSVREIIAG